MLGIHNGDCLEKMKDISDNSVDLIFCDLPYGQTSCKWDTCIDLDLLWEQIKRVRKRGCPIFFTTTTKFGVNLINSNPKEFRYDLIWVKSATTGFLLAKKMPMRKHEMLYVFYDFLPYYDISTHIPTITKEELRITEAKQGGEGCYNNTRPKPTIPKKYDPPLPTSIITFTKKDGGVYGNGVLQKGNGGKFIKYDPPLPTSLVEIKTTRGKHSTEKPVELINWILKYYSKEGDIVLDPTMGCGSTGMACKQMGRKFIGIEYDTEIFLIAEDRLKGNKIKVY